MPDATLKPCPHCGSEHLSVEGVAAIYVMCRDCGAQSGSEEDRAAALAAWNRRAPAPDPLRDRLRGLARYDMHAALRGGYCATPECEPEECGDGEWVRYAALDAALAETEEGK